MIQGTKCDQAGERDVPAAGRCVCPHLGFHQLAECCTACRFQGECRLLGRSLSGYRLGIAIHYEDSAVVWLCLLGPSRWFESLMDLMDFGLRSRHVQCQQRSFAFWYILLEFRKSNVLVSRASPRASQSQG